MPQKVDLLKVFISCPGDVDEERKIVRKVCESISNVTRKNKSIEVRAIDYKENIIPQITGEEAQNVIDAQLKIEDYDIYIGIFWHRYGDPLKNGIVPTVSEFEQALNKFKATRKWPRIQFYFKGVEYKPKNEYEARQLDEISDFRKRIQKLGYYSGFDNALTFQNAISQFIYEGIEQFQAEISYRCSTPKQKYDEIEEYLERTVVTTQNPDEDLLFTEIGSRNLIDLIPQKNRLVLIGDAGTGKTYELRRIAHHYSNEGTTYYPFFVSLNTYTDEKIEDLFHSDWQAVPTNSLLLIMDGYDEIESQYRRSFLKRLELFCEKNPQIVILLSCRSNFYKIETENEPGTLKGFVSIFLEKLKVKQITKYAQSKLGALSSEFIEGLSQKKIEDLVSIPFYLIKLLDLFEKTGSLPQDKATIIETLIRHRLKLDIEHFLRTIDIEADIENAIKSLMRLALLMETLGRNYLSDTEFSQLVPNGPQRNILLHCTAWNNRNQSGKWLFEHNNIQEYLAAKKLSQEKLQIIKNFVSFQPGNKKIIPSWVNTISFLLSISEDPELINWILKIEPEIIVKMEPQKIDERIRVAIVKSIFDNYKAKKIWINRDLYRHGELGYFCNHPDLIDYLIAEGNSQTNPTVISNAIEIIGEMSIPFSHREKVKNFLLNYITNNNVRDSLIHRALHTISVLNITDSETSDAIVEKLKDCSSDRIRYGLYRFLINTDSLDQHISVFTEGIRYLDITPGSNRLLNERIHLRNGLTKTQKPSSLKTIIKAVIKCKREHINFLVRDNGKGIKKIVSNLERAFRHDASIIYDVICFYYYIEKNHLPVIKTIGQFFLNTKTELVAFQDVIEHGLRKHDDLLAIIANYECLDFFKKKLKRSEITKEDFQFFLYSLEFNENIYFESFFKDVNKEFDNIFERRKTIDWKALRKEQNAKDIEVLFDRTLFVKEIESIYKESGLTQLSYNYLYDLKYPTNRQPKYPLVVLDTLANLSLEKEFPLANAIKTIKSWNWDNFLIQKIYRKLKDETEGFTLTDSQNQRIINWWETQLPRVNFKTAIKKSGPSTVTVKNLEKYTFFFFKHYDLELPEQMMLDMVYFDMTGDILPFLEKKMNSFSKIKSKVLEYIYDREHRWSGVLEHHLKFCLAHKVKDSLEFAYNELLNNEFELRYLSLEIIETLSEDPKKLTDLLKNIDGNFKWVVIHSQVEKLNPDVKEHLIELLKSGDKKNRVRAAHHLIIYQHIKALEYYVDTIKSKGVFTRNDHENSTLGYLNVIEAVPFLLTLYKSYISGEINNEDETGFHSISSALNNALKNIALSKEENFLYVKNQIEQFIESYSRAYKDTHWLYGLIEQIEIQYYINKSQNISFKDAIQKIETIG